MVKKFENNSFTEQAAALLQRRWQSIIKGCVREYARITYLLYRRETFMNSMFRDQLTKSLMPKSTDLGNIRFFLDLCNKLLDSFLIIKLQ